MTAKKRGRKKSLVGWIDRKNFIWRSVMGVDKIVFYKYRQLADLWSPGGIKKVRITIEELTR